MVKEFNSLEEIEKYYNPETNTYIFEEADKMIDLVVFNFDLSIESDIKALSIVAWNINAKDIDACNIIATDIHASNIDADNITARNINVWDIDACDIFAIDINASNIEAKNISYYAVCFAYYNIKCKSIIGRRENAKHFVLYGTLEVKDNAGNINI